MSVDPAVTRKFIENLSTHLEDHLAVWKSALADTRTDILALLTAMGDRIPAQAKPLFPEDIVSMLLEDVIPPPPPPERIVERVVEKVVETVNVPVAVPGPATSDWGLVRGSMSAIESSRTQVDVLTRFLGEALVHASRVALLVLRNERVSGWKALGFDASGGRDDGIKTVDFAVGDDPFVAAVLKGERSMLSIPPGESSPLRRALGGRPPARTLLVPMVIRDRLSGILCADELPEEEGRLNEAALEVLTFVTGLAVDLLAARKKIPSPALTPRGEPVAVFQPAGTEAPATAAEPDFMEPSAPPAPEPPPVAAAPAAPRPVMPPPVAAAPSEPPARPAPAPAPVETPRPSGPPSEAALGIPAPSRSVLEPPDFLSRTKKRITDAGEALRALEESATAKKKSEAGISPPADLLSAVARPAGLTPPPVPRISPLELPRPAMLEPPPTVAPLPPPASPDLPPVAVRGDLTMAFESLKTTIPPGPPAAFSEPAPAAPLPPPAPRPPAPPPPAASAATVAVPPVSPMDAGGGFATPMAPPAGFVPRGRLKADDPQRAIEDAKRLARLLVSEIKLYNERKVLEGRAAGDLYERLRDDIERSRQLYNERTPEPVRREASYFTDELVRILADGKRDAMGPMP